MKKVFKDPYEYEKHVASRLPNGRREIASGALSGNYDVNSTGQLPHMVDCKVTSKKSFSVNHDTFERIKKRSRGSVPAMFIHMHEVEDSYVVLKEADYVEIVNMLNDFMEKDEIRD